MVVRTNPELCDSSKLSVDYKHLYIYTCINKINKETKIHMLMIFVW
jgi:hypothetical protein